MDKNYYDRGPFYCIELNGESYGISAKDVYLEIYRMLYPETKDVEPTKKESPYGIHYWASLESPGLIVMPKSEIGRNPHKDGQQPEQEYLISLPGIYAAPKIEKIIEDLKRTLNARINRIPQDLSVK